jgi:hypothetical protein
MKTILALLACALTLAGRSPAQTPAPSVAPWYVNSAANPAAKYEDFIVKDVIGYIDGHHRTLASRESRAVWDGQLVTFIEMLSKMWGATR